MAPDEVLSSTKDRETIEDQIDIKDTKKLILGTVLAAAVAVLVFQKTQKPAGEISLTAAENRFKVEFKIPENQKDDAAQVLEKLTIPQNILGGFEFELDSTSSAKLAFASPIKTQVHTKDGTITLTGKITKGLPAPFELNTSLKIPKNTQIGVATGDFNQIVYRYLETDKLRQWFDASQKKRGQYLIIFGRDNFAIIIPKSGSVDFDSLADAATGPQEVYKQEIFETSGNSVSLHSIKLDSRQKYQLLTLFELGEFLYLTTSPAAARDLVNSQLGNAPASNFVPENLKIASFFAFWTRYDSVVPNVEPALPTQASKYFANIKKANLIILGENFRGLIELVE